MSDAFSHSLTTRERSTRTAFSPISAATLLLLVSLVVSTSPAIRGGPSVAEHRPVAVRAVAVVEDRPDDDRRNPCSSAGQARAAVFHGLGQLDCVDPLFLVRSEPASDAAPMKRIRVRTALLDLPPPIG